MKRLLLVFISLPVLVACAQKPVVTFEVLTPAPSPSFTPWVEGTQMTLATPTPWVAGTQTALAIENLPTPGPSLEPLPTFPFPQEGMEKPTDFSPVVYGGKFYGTNSFVLLGGVSRDGWLAPEMSAARFGGEATYSLHSLADGYKYFVWGTSVEFSPVCKSFSISTEATLDETGFVGVLDGWNITKREMTELSHDGEFYRQVVLDWLKAEGVTSPEIDRLQIQRVDLEGDGSDEIFISATRYDGSQHGTRSGDHSVILMRKVQGNEAVTVLIAGDVYRKPEAVTILPRTYSIANFIDLNQDGALEVVVEIQRWEGFGAAVYQIEDQTVTQVLQGGCGL